jgi:hypothetical protein
MEMASMGIDATISLSPTRHHDQGRGAASAFSRIQSDVAMAEICATATGP